MMSKAKLLAWAVAFAVLGMAPASAQEPKEFKIGVVMSLSGGFVAAAKTRWMASWRGKRRTTACRARK